MWLHKRVQLGIAFFKFGNTILRFVPTKPLIPGIWEILWYRLKNHDYKSSDLSEVKYPYRAVTDFYLRQLVWVFWSCSRALRLLITVHINLRSEVMVYYNHLHIFSYCMVVLEGR